MTRQDLFNLVLPEDGLLCITGLMRDKSKPAVIKYFDMGDPEADVLMAKLDREGREVYFGVASYKDSTQPKEARNVLGKKSFYLDLDVEKNNGYSNKTEALIALDKFRKELGLPVPCIVDSGHGVHAYWPLTKTVDYNTWKPVADAFKRKTLELELKTDRAITADGARILRAPDTTNRAKIHKLKPSLVRQLGEPISIEDFANHIGYVQTDTSSFFSDAYAETKEDKVMEKLLKSTNTFKFSRIYRKSIDIITVTEKVEQEYELPDGTKAIRFVDTKAERSAGCPQISYCVANRETLPEPMWRAALATAQCCIDRKDAIEAVSRGYPGTEPEEWYAKAAKTNGGYSCEEWKMLDQPQLCGQCIHRGKIKNPLALGAVIEEATPEDNLVVTKVAEVGDKLTIEIPSDYPYPWIRPKTGGVAVRGNPDDGRSKDTDDTDADEILIYEHDLWVSEVLKDGERAYAEISCILPHEGLVKFKAPVAELLKLERCQELLNNKACIVIDKKMGLMRKYIAAWIKKLQVGAAPSKAREQFGWHDKDTRFVIGNREIDEEGIVHYSPVVATIENIARIYRKNGTLEEWSKVANVYGRKGNEARAFSLFAGFGAPLFKFIGAADGSCLLHLTNPSSGVGKSTAQKLVNSAWGHPVEALMTDKDTVNAKLHRIGVLNNIPATFDEITNMGGEAASSFSFDLSSGKGKNRMKSHSNEERINNSTWCTIAQTSGNNSLYDVLQAHKSSVEGEMNRILQLAIQEDKNLSKEAADELFGAILPNNYGIAGEEYMKYVVPNRENVIVRLKEIRRQFDKATDNRSKDRYFSNTCAAVFTAAEILNKLGIVDIPVEPVWNWAVELVISTKTLIRKASPTKDSNFNVLVTRYWNDNIARILVTNTSSDSVDDTLLNHAPLRPVIGSLIGRHDVGLAVLYLGQSDFKNWLAEQRLPSDQIVAELKNKTVIIREDSYNLGEGTASYSTAAIPVFVFDTTRLTS